MPTEQPRIQVTLDKQLNALLSNIAGEENISKSSLVAELIKEALELRDDRLLSEISNKRIKENRGKKVSHSEAWK